MSKKQIIVLAAAIVTILAFTYLIRGLLLRADEQQRIRDSHQDFLTSIELNQKGKNRSRLSKQYSDAFGHNYVTLSDRLSEVRSNFSELGIESEITSLDYDPKTPDQAVLTYKIVGLTGEGGPYASTVLSAARKSGILYQQLEVHWQREGIWPGKWQITTIHYPDGFQPFSNYDPSVSVKDQIKGYFSNPF